MKQRVQYPYCWTWCYLHGDFEMFDRASATDLPVPEACYFDEDQGRWIVFAELPRYEQAAILDPALWNEIESHKWSGAPTRVDVGLGPRQLNPLILEALRHGTGPVGANRGARRESGRTRAS